MRLYLATIFGLVLGSTTPVFSAEVTIDSNIPGAQVYELGDSTSSTGTMNATQDEEQKTLLGKTPYVFKDQGGSKVIKIEKRGYTPVYVPVFGQFRGLSLLKVTLKKVSDWLPEDASQKSVEVAEKMVDEIFAVQSLIDSRKFKEALGTAETLHSQHPTSIAASLIYANALLVNGDFARARSIYAGAMEQIPDSRKQLKATLASTLQQLSGGSGGRMPASVKGAKP